MQTDRVNDAAAVRGRLPTLRDSTNVVNRMRLIVNGREKEFRDGLTVDALITEGGEPVGQVLVEVNGEYVPTRLQKGRVLAEGDRVETILPAFGG